jgi:pantothenate kinase
MGEFIRWYFHDRHSYCKGVSKEDENKYFSNFNSLPPGEIKKEEWEEIEMIDFNIFLE